MMSFGLSSRARAMVTRWRWPQPDGAQGLLDQLSRLLTRRRQAEFLDRCGQNVVDLVEGVVDLEGILKDRLHILAEGAHVLLSHRADVHTPIAYCARRRWRDAEQQPRDRRLAATRLAGDGHEGRSVAVDGQGEVVDGHRLGLVRLQQAAAAAVHLAHVMRFKQRGHGQSRILFVQQAGHMLPGSQVREPRLVDGTTLHRLRAARVEQAAARRVEQ